MANREQLDRLEDRDREMWRLYVEESWTQRMIAEKFGVAQRTVSSRLEMVRKHFPPLTREQVVERRVEQVDMLVRAALPAAKTGDPAAIGAYLKLAEREAKLLGLDAPTKQEITGRVARYEIEGVDLDDLT